MAAKEWLTPLLAAIITFAGLYVAQEQLADGPPGGINPSDDGFSHAFLGKPRVNGHDSPATVILLSRDPQTGGGIWRTPHVALQQSFGYNVDCATPWPCGLTHEVASADEPRLLVNGYNATRVTAHVFDESGILLFTNAAPANRSHLKEGLGASDLPNGAWYLGGEATPPNGTIQLPAAANVLLSRLLPLLEGQPHGAIVSTATNAFVGLYGTLFVTIQLNELVYAP